MNSILLHTLRVNQRHFLNIPYLRRDAFQGCYKKVIEVHLQQQKKKKKVNKIKYFYFLKIWVLKKKIHVSKNVYIGK